MTPRTEHLIRILEKIGLPLMLSAMTVPTESGDAADDARTVAALLSRTVQAGIDLGRLTEFSMDGENGDSLRVALAGIAGPLVAALYQKNGAPPDDSDLKKTAGALQAVLSFAQNFEPSQSIRLEELEARGQAADKDQAGIQYLQAFTPVVDAVAAFSFGRPEQTLMTDIASRLSARPPAFRERAFPGGMDPAAAASLDLALLRTMAQLYAAAHRQITARLLSMDGAGAPSLSLDDVWTGFELRAGILEALAANLLPGAQNSSTQSPAPQTPAASPAAPLKSSPIAAASASGAPAVNPMAMFAQPKAAETVASKPPEAPPPAVEPATRRTAPVPGEAVPPLTAPTEEKEEKPAKNPMSFFGGKPKEDDE
ncbi:MAG: hypothetical protein K9G62_00840 [Alphaproteobacteria bacterium]|nr:hypothetical protein [Alphaproteobacteria bacterium]